jgi:predicted TIM-barrel fold metal-dependent hydrolase
MDGMRLPLTLLALALAADEAAAQSVPPIIDMHLHADTADAEGPPPLAMCTPIRDMAAQSGQDWATAFMAGLKKPACPDPVWSPLTDDALMNDTLEVLRRRNIVGVLSGPIERVQRWRSLEPDRVIPALQFQMGRDNISPDQVRALHEEGRFVVFGEVTNQYVGIGPSDASFEPYLAVAEERGFPVGIHIGTGPPGAPYLGFGRYRAALHSPLLLEEALVRHPKLRVYIMHAGWPMLDDLLAVLWAHPQVYVDTGVIDYVLPRAEFHRYLQRIVEAGFGKRVMFGSDQMVWPGVVERAIESIDSATFLSEAQKRDILYNNAANFLRFSEAQIAKHHGR